MAKSASKSARKRTTKPSAGSEPDVTAQARPARKNGAKAAKAPPAPAPAPKDEPLEPAGTIFVGQSVKPERILLGMSNRHGLATGATGTGKTVTLQVLAEGFSRNGVPVFAKGSNWIPADSFPTRITDESLETLIRAAADTHQNMLRVWGGGFYEEERFYDLCDRYGILVWQEGGEAVGGQLRAQSRPEGGWETAAWLPRETAPAE